MAENVCYGHADLQRTALGHRSSGRTSEPVFTDSRTGRSFCHDCVAQLVTWELDGRPEPGEHPFLEWIGEASDG